MLSRENTLSPSHFKTLSGAEHLEMLALAERTTLSAVQEHKSQTAINADYQNGVLLIERVGGPSWVVSLRETEKSIHVFEADNAHYRTNARLWFKHKAAASDIPYYLRSDQVPSGLRLVDLPIMVGRYLIKQNSKPFQIRANPLSGHRWSEPTGLARHCSIQGGEAHGSTRYGTVQGALADIAYFERHPYAPELSEREQAYIESQDQAVTASYSRRPRAT